MECMNWARVGNMKKNEELRKQYNEIYKNKPDKWADIVRDNNAWFMLNRILGKPPISLLDIGCGNGHTIEYFKDRWPNIQYTGIDLSDEAIKIASEKMPDVNWICSDIEDINLFNVFDVITILGTAEHFYNLKEKMEYISKFLAPKGVLYLEVPNNLEFVETQNKEEGFRKSAIGQQEEWHLHKKTWDNILREAGYVTYITRVRDNPFYGFMWILQKIQTF